MPLSEHLQIDDEHDVATVHGVKFSGELLRTLTESTPDGFWFAIKREGDAIAIHRMAGTDPEVVRLEKLVYVPGLWRCPKCKLQLISSTLHVNIGRLSANTEPQRCPNECGPMWRITERDAGNEVIDRRQGELNSMIERCAKVVEGHAKSDLGRGRLQAPSILERVARSIRALKQEETRGQMEVQIPKEPT